MTSATSPNEKGLRKEAFLLLTPASFRQIGRYLVNVVW